MIRLTIAANGQSFAGTDRRDCVRQMRDNAWMWGDPKRAYLESVALRVSDERGVAVVFETVDDFVEIMVALGYLIETLDD